MNEEQVGTIIKYFAKPGVAAIKMTNGSIKIGDSLRFKGSTTEFDQKVISMEVDNQRIEEAKAGDLVGIKVNDRVRENDKVYKIVE